MELAADAPHPPVFACVMRRTGVPKQLECHGFVCTSSEDAIIIAANLYQALLETMKRQRQDQARRQQQQRRRAARSNTSSMARGGVDGDDDDIAPPPSVFSDSDTAPVRPPRKKNKKSSRGEGTPQASLALQRKKSLRSSIRSNRSNGKGAKRATVTIDPTRRTARALARSDSGRRSIRSNGGSGFARRSTRKSGRRPNGQRQTPTAYSTQLAPPQPTPGFPGGDVYTRVAIPRSKSFMNVGSQYNLQELFRELKEKEGVESIDDVLKKVITPNGISFNEIKPVYRELLLKLAMTMSQDEIFQRSKNIISQEKKKRKQEKEKDPSKKEKKGKNSASGTSTLGNDNGSSSNTISSFFKMTFSSSSKSNSLAGGGKKGTGKKGKAGEPQINTLPVTVGAKGGNEGDSGFGSNGGSGSHFDKPLPIPPQTITTKSRDKSINKADISGPLPITMPLPLPSSSLTKHNPSTRTPAATRKKSKLSVSKSIDEKSAPSDDSGDPYASCCSECGGVYESVCNYDTCSCRVKDPPQRESIHSLSHSTSSSKKKSPYLSPPPSASTEGGQHPSTVGKPPLPHPSAGSANRLRHPPHHHPQRHQDGTEDPDEIYCDCDGESCASSEKCYCSLRGDPRDQNHHQHRTRVAVHRDADEKQQQMSPPSPHSHHRIPNNTTIIHCSGGSGTDTIRSFSSVSSCSTCNFHTCDSGSTATDTTCYSIKHQRTSADGRGVGSVNSGDRYNSHSSLLSGCESPQTAWSRNSRLTSPDSHPRHSSRTSSHQHDDRHSFVNSCPSEYSDASIARRRNRAAAPPAPGSSCSACSHHQQSRPVGRAVSSLCGSSSNSSSGCSHHSAPVYGGGHQHPRSGVRRATSKVLLVSATDRSGRVSTLLSTSLFFCERRFISSALWKSDFALHPSSSSQRSRLPLRRVGQRI